MADLKISQLTSATTPLAGTETLPVVQSSTTKKVTVSNLTAGRDIVAKTFSPTVSGYTVSSTYPLFGYYTAGTPTGYVQIPNTGIFQVWKPSTQAALTIDDATSSIKADLGNFVVGTAAKGINFTANTPLAGMTSQLLNWYEEGTFTPTAANISGTNTYAGTYTRIGNRVYFEIIITTTTTIVITGASSTLSLPFASGVDNTCAAANRSTGAGYGTGLITGSSAWPPTCNPGASQSIVVSGSYRV